MADRKNKINRKSMRKQRWAAIVAAIIAAGMVLSSVFIYFDFAAGRNRTQEQGLNFEEYLDYSRGEIARLEQFLSEHEPNVAVLEALANSYSNLMILQQLLPGDEEEASATEEKLVDVYKQLIELAPSELRYRIELLYAYQRVGMDQETILAEASHLAGLLRENSQTALHLPFIDFLAEAELEQLLQEEIFWLSAYLEKRIEDGEADNFERYYLAVLSAEHLSDLPAAKAQLELIMETEEEGSSLYNQAKQYRESLTENEERSTNGTE